MLKWLRPIMGAMLLLGMSFSATSAEAAGSSWQCAPFARMFSGIQLFGNAASWWDQAVGKYLRGNVPEVGSVLVFKAFKSMRVGHVATVSEIVSSRIIKVTHANWSVINGRRGQVEKDVTVVDTSEKGDWSKVKVWYASLKDVGQTAYPVYGFIYKGGDAKPADADTLAQLAGSAEPNLASSHS